MMKRNLLELALKAFGIYLVVAFIRSIPQLLLVLFTMDTLKYVTNRTAYLMLMVFHTLVPLFLAALFLFWSRKLAALVGTDEDSVPRTEETKPAYMALSFWIVIIGLYYFVTSAADMFNNIIVKSQIYSASRNIVMQFGGRDLIPSAVMFLISLLFIFRAKAIAGFIDRREKGKTQSL